MTIDTGLKDQLELLSQDDVRDKKTSSIHLTVPVIGELECYQVLRVIRRKRAVCRARHRQNEFLVKFFFASRKAKRHWNRNDRGCRIFLDRSIPAPNIHFSGFISRYGIYVIVYEYIQPTVNIGGMLKQGKIPLQDIEFFLKFIETLAQHHNQGIIQCDAHLNNFLISGKKIYSLDGDQVKISKGPVARRQSLDNLITFYANLPAVCDRYASRLGRIYFSKRGWSFKENDEKVLLQKIQKKRGLFLGKFLSKIYRSRDPFQAICKKNLWAVFDKSNPGLTPESIAEHFNEPFLCRILDAHDGNARVPIVLPGIKDPVRILISNGPFWRSNRWKNKLFRRWKNAMMLNRLGIKTCRPLILIKRRTRLFHSRVGLIEWELKGVAANEFFLLSDKSEAEKQKLALDIAIIFFVLKQAGLKADTLCLNDFIITRNCTRLTAPEKISSFPKATDPYWKSRIMDFISSAGSENKAVSEILQPVMVQFDLIKG